MRMLKNLFLLVAIAALSTSTFATNPTPPAALTNPQTNAPEQTETPEREPILLPGTSIVEGSEQNEFFVIDQNKPVPPALAAQRKQAEDRMKAVQTAVNESAKTIKNMNTPKLDKVLSDKAHTIDIEKQTNDVITNALKQPIEATEAENDIKPLASEKINGPVISDAVSETPLQKPTAAVAKPVQAPKKVEIKKIGLSLKTKHSIKHSLTKKRRILAVAPKKVIKPQIATRKVIAVKSKKMMKKTLVSHTKKQPKKTIAVVKKPNKKTLAQASKPTKKISLNKTERKIVYNHTEFKVKSLKVDG